MVPNSEKTRLSRTDSLKEEPRLCLWGEFCDPLLEKNYLDSSLHTKKRSLYPVLAILVLVFSLFLVPDVLANRGNPRLPLILGIRSGVILWLLLLFPAIRKVKTSSLFTVSLSLSQGIVGFTFLYVSSLYGTPDFSLQVLALAMLILSFFALPCSLKYTSLVSGLVWLFFLWLASGRFPGASERQWLVSSLFPLLFLLVAFAFRLRIEREQRKMYGLQRKLEILSESDPLTGAANRYRFDRELGLLFQDARDKGRLFSVMIMDVDRFKEVNDRYGHQTGDLVLVGLCGVFREHLRDADLLVRWGGEEFAVLLPDTDEGQAEALAQEIRIAVEKTLFTPDAGRQGLSDSLSDSVSGSLSGNSGRKDPSGEVISITGSFGIAQACSRDTGKTLLGRADRRMYRAKELGRNRVVSRDHV